jgi:hypothetical protein
MKFDLKLESILGKKLNLIKNWEFKNYFDNLKINLIFKNYLRNTSKLFHHQNSSRKIYLAQLDTYIEHSINW